MALELASGKGVINYHTPEFVYTSIYIDGRGDKRGYKKTHHLSVITQTLGQIFKNNSFVIIESISGGVTALFTELKYYKTLCF